MTTLSPARRSLSAIRDSCAVYYSLHAIDSVRVHAPAPIRTTILVTLLVGSVYMALSMIGVGGPGS
jgi:hypothetical protein